MPKLLTAKQIFLRFLKTHNVYTEYVKALSYGGRVMFDKNLLSYKCYGRGIIFAEPFKNTALYHYLSVWDDFIVKDIDRAPRRNKLGEIDVDVDLPNLWKYK